MVKCPFRINAIPPYNAITDGGCHADGSTDDTVHLEQAAAAAVAAGKRLYLPAGSYACAGQVDLISSLYMYGDGVSTILLPAASQCLRIDGKSNLTLRDFKIDGNYSSTDFGILFGGGDCTNVALTGIYVQDMLDSGIYSNCLASAFVLTDCHVSNCRDFGIHFHNEGAQAFNGLTLNDCTAIGIPGSASYPPHGMYMKVGANLTMIDCVAGTIDTNALWGNESAIEIDDVNTGTLTNCDVYGAAYGIQFSRYGTVPTAVGCQNINVYASGGAPDSCGNYERYEYLLNDVTWDGDCYGELAIYNP